MINNTYRYTNLQKIYLFQNIKCDYCGEVLAVTMQEEIFHHKCLKCYDENMHAVSIDEDFVVTISKFCSNNI